MPDKAIEKIITRDRSSGRYHIRLNVNGRIFAQEQCNLDDAGAYEIVSALPEDIDSVKLCRNCFPTLHDNPITNE
jgi:hypothetical protein